MIDPLKIDVLEKHIITILTTYFDGVNLNNPLRYNFRCNVCGDSKTNKFKKRGYILKDHNPWIFYCHNCQAKMSAEHWMKEFFHSEYMQYRRELMYRNNSDKLEEQKNILINKTIERQNRIKDFKKSEEEKEQEAMKFFVPINKGDNKIFDIAKKQCQKRLIDEEIWSKWFVAVDGKYKNRIIIPFFDDKNKIYYYQGRSIYSNMIPKYLSRFGDNHNNIYNYYNVDKEKNVIVLEGLIDSLFVENSIAMTGLKIEDKKLNNFENKMFLLDDDDAGNERSLKLLQEGKYVFKWKEFLKDLNVPRKPDKKDKWDVNELCMYINRKEMFKLDEIEKYFTNNFYDSIFFRS